MSEFEFVLALDVGMSRIVAATACLAPSGEVGADSFVLGHRSGSIAAVAFVTDDGDLLFGDTAEQRGFERPERVLRAFTRTVGDQTPLVVGDLSITAEDVCARLARWAEDTAAQREGSRPSAITITHPSSWTRYRAGALQTSLTGAGLDDVALLSSGEAAVLHHDASHPLETGDTVAVYDLGGSSFEATLLRKEADGGFARLGEPVAVADVGGDLFDDAVLRHAISTAGVPTVISEHDTETHVALSRLRRASTAAKEALSFDADATIPVTVAERNSSVRLTRSEVEAMIDPVLERTLDALEHAVDAAHLRPEQLELILLIGGSAHIPLVAQRLSERFDRPIVSAPDAAAALGAARTQFLRRRDRLRAEASLVDDVAVSAAPAQTKRPRRRLLPSLRPLLTPSSLRSATPAAFVITGTLVAVGIAASAVAAMGMGGATDDAEGSSTTADAAQTRSSSTSQLELLNPFDGLLPGVQSLQITAPAPGAQPDPEAPPGSVQLTPRRVVHDALSDSSPEQASRGGPQPEPSSPNPGAAPAATTPVPSPSTQSPSQPAAPEPSATPTEAPIELPTESPTEPVPSEPPPVDPPVDPPPADDLEPQPADPSPAPSAPSPAPSDSTTASES